MTSTPPFHAADHAFLMKAYEVIERTQNLNPKPDRAELLESLRPLRDQLVHMSGSSEELDAARSQMRHHLEQFAATSLGSPEARQIMHLTDPNAVAQMLAGTSGDSGAKDTYEELLELPRGRGMRAADITDRMGPGLRAACRVTWSDAPDTVQRKVADRLVELCERLPADLRVSVLAALALHPEADHQFMQDRMTWAAQRINRDHPRAAVRRMKVGFRILAEQLGDMVGVLRHRQGWYTSSLRALLRMDVSPPQLVEERAIVAEDDLTEIELRFSAPDSGPLTYTVLYGGEITRTERVTPSHSKFTVRLTKPLRVGEVHEYGVRFTTPPLAAIPPYYILTPLQPCEKFTVRVRFGANVPNRLWRLDGIPPRAIDDFEPPGGQVKPDRFGEVALEFEQLQQGLSYGLRWSTEQRTTSHQAIAESH